MQCGNCKRMTKCSSHHPLHRSPQPAPQGHKAVVFGVPDCGKVCSEQHVPGYLQRWDDLRRLGVSRIVCVAVGDPAAADAWAAGLGAGVADSSKVTVAADANGAFTRFLGMDQGAVDAPGPRSLRYAAVVDDGTLLKVVRRAGVGWGGARSTGAVGGRRRKQDVWDGMLHARSRPCLCCRPPSLSTMQCVDKCPAEAKASSADSVIAFLKAMH